MVVITYPLSELGVDAPRAEVVVVATAAVNASRGEGRLCGEARDGLAGGELNVGVEVRLARVTDVRPLRVDREPVQHA